jgi:hypothetical protein
VEHLRELYELAGVERVPYTFSAENGEAHLATHFAAIERRDTSGWNVFPGRAEAQEFLDHSIIFKGRQLPRFDGPLRVRRAPVVFVATKA